MRVLVPWRETPSRVAPLERVVRWHAARGRSVELVDAGGAEFSLAASRNAAMAGVGAREVVVLSDADVIPQEGPLLEAAAAAASSGLVHLPYTRYVFEGGGGMALACSGVFVTSGAAFFAAGGMDERFRGWAPEDFAFQMAHRCLLGEMPRHEGELLALSHAPARRGGVAAWQRHLGRYQAARGDRAAMRALVSGNLGRWGGAWRSM